MQESQLTRETKHSRDGRRSNQAGDEKGRETHGELPGTDELKEGLSTGGVWRSLWDF